MRRQLSLTRALAGLVLVGLVAAGLLACRGASEPVARLSLRERQLGFPHGRFLPLELRWEPSRALPAGTTAPVAFMHLIDAQGNVVRTFDHALPGKWTPGQTLVDVVPMYHSAIGPALPAGDYRLTIGLYDGKSQRFALQVEGEPIHREEYAVAQVRVPEVSAQEPAFAFSPEWQAVEAGGDRQTVARRWLSGDGALDVRGLPTPATVHMLLRIPTVEPPLRLVLEPGATQPIARVTADCGGFTAEVAGEGFHELAVPIKGGEGCHIAFDTNYQVVEMGTGRRLSLDLEQLGWEPGAGAMATPGGVSP
ncbi:MAG TPA: hypothetical protein VGV61_03475 [Thermoanaerobaculia bacterium]|jgi:hypothetical protein|nr:hypothetical protein [Thermoanaerobaculia bacterium]